MAKRPLIMMATVALLALLALGLIPGTAAVLSDDPGNKISGSLELLMLEKSEQRDMLLQGTGPVDQIVLAETGRATVFIYLDRPPDAAVTAGLQSMGATVYPDSWIPPVGPHPRGFITASVPLDGISNVAGLSYVARIDSAEVKSQPQNDLAAAAIGTQAYWPAGYNGSGVRIAVLDSGLDTTFPDLPTPFAAKDYSTYPVIGDNVSSNVVGGRGAHGTHVAGSALGRGTLSGGKYKGMAYDSEFVFLKIGNNINAGSSDEIEVAALKAAVDIYQANVINMSYGGWSAHHDGTSAPSQAVDYVTSKGATVCISAGNEADRGLHYFGALPSHTSIRVPVVVWGSNGSNCTLRHNLVWWDGVGVHDNLTMVYYDGDTQLPTQSTSRDESVRGTEQQYWWWGDNPSHWYYIPADKTSYGIAVSNNSDNARQFHLYFAGLAERGAAVRFESPDIYYTISDPAEADGAIASGAYTTRTSWTDFRGYPHTSDEVMNTVTAFSSRGPRLDPGAPQKPAIVSPGSEIISCRDGAIYPADNNTISDNGINDGAQPANYLVMEGTSMASPVTAGMVAVLMEAYPGLKINPTAVKNLLQQSATRYSTPDNNWGYGLVSLQRVLQMWPQSVTVPSSADQGSLVFSTSAGTIGNVRTMDATALGSSCAAAPNLFPYGVFSFDISGILPGSSVDVTVTMPDSRATIYWKCTPAGLTQMPVVSTGSNSMVIRLTDGGLGDADGIANGVIVDPGGPGLPLAQGLAVMPASRSSSPITGSVMQPVMLPNPNVTAQSAIRAQSQPETTAPTSKDGDAAGEGFAVAVMAALIAAIGVVIIMLWRRRAY